MCRPSGVTHARDDALSPGRLERYGRWNSRRLRSCVASFRNLRVSLFGVPDPGSNIPSWAHYHQRPTAQRLRQLYNEAAVFVAPSRAEGWGLPGSEAMMCGAAVVATDIGGHREFCIAGETALMAPAGDIERLAAQLVNSLCSDAASAGVPGACRECQYSAVHLGAGSRLIRKRPDRRNSKVCSTKVRYGYSGRGWAWVIRRDPGYFPWGLPG